MHREGEQGSYTWEWSRRRELHDIGGAVVVECGGRRRWRNECGETEDVKIR
jgi:hypothetical protein